MRASIHRLISTAIFLGWLTPSVGALAVGMHLASEHHEPHGPNAVEHQQEFAHLVSVATHGHHHDLHDLYDLHAEPDHHHDVRLDTQAPAHRPGPSLIAALPAPPTLSAASAGRLNLDRSQRRGPPKLLFRNNCSLLL